MVLPVDTQSNGKAESLQGPGSMIEGTLVIEAPKEEISSYAVVTGLPRSPSVGRIKEPPVQNPSLKKESMPSEELSKLCFPPGSNACDCSVPSGTSASSSSSISSRESDQQSSSAQMNAKVITQKTSRQGRETQRWAVDPNTRQRVRLVTGSVPILNDGRIMLVSSSRKAEWILPKGGWELDETMEESAVRESYEEAGVLGTLGPRLSEIQYETRKSKKRRLEMKKKKEDPEMGFSSGASDVGLPDDEQQTAETGNAPLTKAVGNDTCSSLPPPPAVSVSEPLKTPQVTMSKDAVDRIRSTSSVGGDETSSVASDGSTHYSLVRLTLFPLYVREVKDDWPESGRFRKAVDIDEAIEMMKSRPEFHAVLMEVKEKGIHLVASGQKETQ